MENSKTVLVIEDERPLQEAIKAKLEKSGFAVVSARSVDQSLGYLEEDMKVDAIWLDHYLFGKGNGLDFVTTIKQEGSKWKNIPVFVVSNTATPEKVNSYLRLGVNKYYTKADHKLADIIGDIQEYLESKD